MKTFIKYLEQRHEWLFIATTAILAVFSITNLVLLLVATFDICFMGGDLPDIYQIRDFTWTVFKWECVLAFIFFRSEKAHFFKEAVPSYCKTEYQIYQKLKEQDNDN